MDDCRQHPSARATSFALTLDKLKAKTKAQGDCWIWDRACSDDGYGAVFYNGKTARAHRVSYILAKGVIPDGLVLDHLCRVPRCINPDHLEAVTNTENLRRGFGRSANNFKKTHCINGHLFDEANTRMHRGNRHCRACVALRSRAYHSRRRAALEVGEAANG